MSIRAAGRQMVMSSSPQLQLGVTLMFRSVSSHSLKAHESKSSVEILNTLINGMNGRDGLFLSVFQKNGYV